MKKTLLGIIMLALLASCSPSEEQIAQAILQTQASAPTAKPTRTPLPTPRYSDEDQYALIEFCEDYQVFLNAQIEFLDEHNPWIEATRLQSAPDPDGARRIRSLADPVWLAIMAARRPEPAREVHNMMLDLWQSKIDQLDKLVLMHTAESQVEYDAAFEEYNRLYDLNVIQNIELTDAFNDLMWKFDITPNICERIAS